MGNGLTRTSWWAGCAERFSSSLWNLSSGSAHSFRMRQHAVLFGPCPHPWGGRVDEPAGLTGLRDRAISQVSQGPTAQPGPQSHLGSTGPPFMTLALTPHPDWREADPWTSFSYHRARNITQTLTSCALIHAQHLHCSALICYPPALNQSRKGDWFGPFCSPWSYGGRKPVFFRRL